MDIISNSKFRSFCKEHGIRLPDKKVGIGRYPSFDLEAQRTINIHLKESDVPNYLFKLLEVILGIETKWILLSKFKYLEGLDGFGPLTDEDAIQFEKDEQSDICHYLSNLLSHIRCVTDDLFLVCKSGKIIIRYDHHVLTEGLSISLNDITVAGNLLQGLNKLGAELELYYCRA